MDESSITGPQSIDGDAFGLYPKKEGSSPSEGSCLQCGKDKGKNPKFCSRSCSVSFNNHKVPKRSSNSNPIYCLNCNKPCKKNAIAFCSQACHKDYDRNSTINKWLDGKIDGLNTNGCVIKAIKDFYRFIFNDSCQKCGWSKLNIFTNKIPLEMNHIDGNYLNNRPENLELICPNCHSLTNSYRGANIGKGRKIRRK